MSLNPSHILIARNSRGSTNPSASLSFPTETHAAAAGIFRSSGSPTGYFEDGGPDDDLSDISAEYYEKSIEITECFTKQSRFPGTVKIIVENTTFWSVSSLSFPYHLRREKPGLKLTLTVLCVTGHIARCSILHPPFLRRPSVETGRKLGVEGPCPRWSPFHNHPQLQEIRRRMIFFFLA
jgi:hypothetical protein